jgi:hypothetical protein
MDDPDGRARRDAALATVVLVPVAGTAVVLGAPFAPSAVALGAAGTVVLEGLLSLRAARVRSVWADRRTQVTGVVAAACLALVGTVVVGPWILTALTAALCTYLGLLGAGVLWRRRDDDKH